MAGATVLYNGKNKQQIAAEAFEKLTPLATHDEVSRFFREYYGIKQGCGETLYWKSRGIAKRAAGLKTNKGRAAVQPLPVLRKHGGKPHTEYIREIFREHGADLTTQEVLDLLAAKGIAPHTKSIYDVRLEFKQKVSRSKRQQTTTGTTVVAGVTLEDARTVKNLCATTGLTAVKSVLEVIGSMGLPNFRQTLELLETLQLTEAQ